MVCELYVNEALKKMNESDIKRLNNVTCLMFFKIKYRGNYQNKNINLTKYPN